LRRWIVFILLFFISLGGLSWLYKWIRRSGSEDEIHFSAVTGNHSAAILIDGRRAACVDDEVQRATQTVAVGNILSPSACDSRVAVLVQDNAMYFAERVGTWTDETGDTLDVALEPVPRLPISIWAPTGGTGDAQVHVDSAGPIYNDMQCGIGFDQVVPI